LIDKSILVMGGTSGIGVAAARALIGEGARVVCLGRDEVTSESARQELGSRARVITGEAGEAATAGTAVREAVEFGGRLDGLFHVAGGSGRSAGDGPLHELSDGGWHHTIRLNLESVFHSNRAAVQQFLQQGGGGAVLNLGSVLARSPAPHFFATHAYATAKAGVEGLTRAAAAHYAPENIRFNALAAGLVATPMSARAQGSDSILGYLRSKQPLDGGRIGQPGDLLAAILFFLSDASRFVTGQVLAVDGGWSVSEGQHGGLA
jgi:NAD(P)-dependent dehydrogenase (short-subunit alcohol dehydrogenase family)